MHEGSLLTLRGPVGKFTLPDTIETDIYLISTGTGIAPFRSMAKFVLENNIPHKHIHFIFGCRKFADALYQDELEALQKQHSGFFIILYFLEKKKYLLVLIKGTCIQCMNSFYNKINQMHASFCVDGKI